MAKVTFVLDEATVRMIRTLAERRRKAQSQIVREAVAAYGAEEERLTVEERAEKLALLERVAARPRSRTQAAVDAEQREVRRGRRVGWPRPRD
jgi:predicted transcriptional regulator